jgi:hypothetical protein
VITYLAVSAVLNIALGYALAVYLGHTRMQTSDSLTPRPATPIAAAPPAPAATIVPVEPSKPETAQAKDDKGWAESLLRSELAAEPVAAEVPVETAEAAAGAAGPVPAPAAELDDLESPALPQPAMEDLDSASRERAAGPTEVEQELLAGIEEFRNQLAQLQSGAAGPAANRPAAVQAS